MAVFQPSSSMASWTQLFFPHPYSKIERYCTCSLCFLCLKCEQVMHNSVLIFIKIVFKSPSYWIRLLILLMVLKVITSGPFHQKNQEICIHVCILSKYVFVLCVCIEISNLYWTFLSNTVLTLSVTFPYFILVLLF